MALIMAALSSGCFHMGAENSWKGAVDHQAGQLGYRNWIVVAEASFPAHNRPGIRQVSAPVEIPEAVDYVLQAAWSDSVGRAHLVARMESIRKAVAAQ